MSFHDSWSISKEDVSGAVAGSGYPFELEIARRIEAEGYFVTPNYNFQDHDSGESREIDVHAIGAEEVARKRLEYLFPVIIASCKANTNPYVFFTRDNVLKGIQLYFDTPISGIPLEIIDPSGEAIPAVDFFSLETLLHIGEAPKISSQFCQLERHSNEWRVSQAPLMQSVVVPLIKCLNREIADHNANCAEPEAGDNTSNYQIYFPVLIARGPLFEYYLPSEGGSPVITPIQHLVVVRHYQSKNLQGEFAFDIIHESFLEKFLQLIQDDTRKVVNRLHRHRKRIVASIEAIRSANEAKAGAEVKRQLKKTL